METVASLGTCPRVQVHIHHALRLPQLRGDSSKTHFFPFWTDRERERIVKWGKEATTQLMASAPASIFARVRTSLGKWQLRPS